MPYHGSSLNKYFGLNTLIPCLSELLLFRNIISIHLFIHVCIYFCLLDMVDRVYFAVVCPEQLTLHSSIALYVF